MLLGCCTSQMLIREYVVRVKRSMHEQVVARVERLGNVRIWPSAYYSITPTLQSSIPLP